MAAVPPPAARAPEGEPLPAAAIEARLDEHLDLVLSSRRTAAGPARELAAFSRAEQELVLRWVAVLAAAHAELAYQFASLAPRALRLMDEAGVEAWVRQAMDTYDGAGLYPAVAALREVEAFAERARARAAGLALEEVAGVLERYVRGLGGRPLKVEAGESPWTDTETLHLPPVVGMLGDREGNFRLYKAMAVCLWAQCWFGTWRPPQLARLREAGDEAAAFEPPAVSTKLKVTGIDLFSVGEIATDKGHEEIVFRDPGRGIYKRLVIEDDRIIGVVLYGDTTDSSWFFAKLKAGEDIGPIRETLIFGPAYAEGAPADPLSAVAALPPEAEICGCNGVCKGDIVAAIEGGACDLAAIRATTKASASCGTCTGLVEQVLAATLGDDFKLPEKKGICPCTDLSHEDIRRLIRAQALKTMPAVMQEAGWKSSCGCHICRPALNFYLLAEWPLEYADDAQSRLVNERNHANIQKDGTYSVMPRMWGGMTTPAELRAIADAAEKYNVPAVKVTGGQRIDLLGVKKEDLPSIWADLNAAGMVSGHAYSKGLRTVKTCVGSDFCRFGTQDSTGLGIRLEKILWGSWTPHKVKLGVSGCPRNCAEATCKDIGIVCVDSGYEIGVAGAAGMDLKKTEPLVKVETEEEVIEHVTAFIQLYRENAAYLDRPYKWVARVGMDWVREQVVEDGENRRALCERFEISQSVYRKDPWAEQAGEEYRRRKWEPLADLTREAAE